MSDIRFNQWLHQSGTGGVSQVASGAVGVGTTNPLADFYVRGDAQITGILTAGHIAMGSSITFGDDDRAYFGDGTDLQIYHSGSHSFIQDTGTGALFIDSNSVQIRNAVASKTTAKFFENAQVELYFNNTERIRTTNTGAFVTGILTATSFSGNGANITNVNATTLDSIDSGSFLRSDATDTCTGQMNFTNQIISIADGNRATQGGAALVIRHSTNSAMRANHFIHDDFPSGKATYYIQATESGVSNDRNLSLQGYGGKVKIGSGGVEPVETLDVSGNVKATSINLENSIFHTGDTDTLMSFSTDTIKFDTAGSERFRIGSNGEILTSGVTSEPLYPHYVTARKVQMEIKGAIDVGQTRHHGSLAVNCTNSNSSIHLVRSDNTQTDGTHVGVLGWVGYDGSDFHQAAAIEVVKGAGAGNNDQPGHMIFKTNEGTTSATERLRIKSDGNITFGHTSSSLAVTNARIKYISGGRDYWNGAKGDYRAMRFWVYDNAQNIDDVYGMGVSSGELEIQANGDLGFYAGSSGSGTGLRKLRFKLDASEDALIFESNTKLFLKGVENDPRNYARINIGRDSTGETRAIDIWGSWSANENKSISFTHGTTSSQIVGQINCIHTSPGSSLRWGKLYHSGDSSTYTMTLDSTSTTGADLTLHSGTFKNTYNGSQMYGAQINDNQTSGTHIQFQRQGYNNGNITHSTNSCAYNTTGSDRTLKKNFEDWNENTLDLFKSLKPQKFNFKTEDDGAEKTKGYIAQDLVDSFPEAYPKEVVSDKYMFNPSGMVPYLMKALQEEIAKREALEARISALEGS